MDRRRVEYDEDKKPEDPREHGFEHPTAFCIVRYKGVESGEIEDIWNTRDGGVPKEIELAETGEIATPTFEVCFDPGYVPRVGDRVIVDMTEVRARVTLGIEIDKPEYRARLEERFASREEALAELVSRAMMKRDQFTDLLVVTDGFLRDELAAIHARAAHAKEEPDHAGVAKTLFMIAAAQANAGPFTDSELRLLGEVRVVRSTSVEGVGMLITAEGLSSSGEYICEVSFSSRPMSLVHARFETSRSALRFEERTARVISQVIQADLRELDPEKVNVAAQAARISYEAGMSIENVLSGREIRLTCITCGDTCTMTPPPDEGNYLGVIVCSCCGEQMIIDKSAPGHVRKLDRELDPKIAAYADKATAKARRERLKKGKPS